MSNVLSYTNKRNRIATLNVVNDLIEIGHADSERDALSIIISKNDKSKTGFPHNLKKAYQKYKEFKKKYEKEIALQIQNQPKPTSQNLSNLTNQKKLRKPINP